MIRIATAFAAAALFVCGCASSSQDVKKADPLASKTVREGRVMSISSEHLTLVDTLHPRHDSDLVLQIAPATTFMKAGQNVQRADVEEGAAVRVYYDAATGSQPVAARVEVLPPDSMPPVRTTP